MKRYIKTSLETSDGDYDFMNKLGDEITTILSSEYGVDATYSVGADNTVYVEVILDEDGNFDELEIFSQEVDPNELSVEDYAREYAEEIWCGIDSE